ncbi:hypothetical protein PM082_006153 [Marasmius tenuissimus]|nr:hypothetical protein PM082_006153 [Marasmius tenuissimus]
MLEFAKRLCGECIHVVSDPCETFFGEFPEYPEACLDAIPIYDDDLSGRYLKHDLQNLISQLLIGCPEDNALLAAKKAQMKKVTEALAESREYYDSTIVGRFASSGCNIMLAPHVLDLLESVYMMDRVKALTDEAGRVEKVHFDDSTVCKRQAEIHEVIHHESPPDCNLRKSGQGVEAHTAT